MKKTFLILITVLTAAHAFAQTEKKTNQIRLQILEMETIEQSCTDSGIFMYGCAKTFYDQMDSTLNAVYKRLRLQLTTSECERLKKEQREWLKKRDAAADKHYKDAKEADIGSANQIAFATHLDALFIENRIFVLLKRLK